MESAAGRYTCRLWVIHVISSALWRRPLHTQLQTFRCVALTDVQGHNQTHALQQNREEGIVGTTLAMVDEALSTLGGDQRVVRLLHRARRSPISISRRNLGGDRWPSSHQG